MGYLDLPERTGGRQLPYEIVHPILIEEYWKVALPNKMRLEDLNDSINTPWMRFSKEAAVSEDGTLVNVRFRYQMLSNEVAAEDLARYAEAVSHIHDMASFYVEDERAMGAAVEVAVSQTSPASRAGSLDWWLLLPGLALLLARRFRSPLAGYPYLKCQ